MNTTERKAAARRAVSFGHFRPTATSAWVNCPLCRTRIVAEFAAWAGVYDIDRRLRAAVEEHLDDKDGDCRTLVDEAAAREDARRAEWNS